MISVVGWHDVGKTAFIVALIAELKRRGLRVATIKHTRGSFDVDKEGTDTWRHAQAGSDIVVISGPSKVAFIEHRESELSLDDVVARLPSSIDLVITEGYKGEDKPKIEITSRECVGERIVSPEELITLVKAGEMDNGEAFSPDVMEKVLRSLEQKGIIK
ncbi:MAG: molybdopterin-guanine dinucleotide biosynthesis protein B [Anaerolineales bacterium]